MHAVSKQDEIERQRLRDIAGETGARIVALLPASRGLLSALLEANIDEAIERLCVAGLAGIRRCGLSGKEIIVPRYRKPAPVPEIEEPRKRRYEPKPGGQSQLVTVGEKRHLGGKAHRDGQRRRAA